MHGHLDVNEFYQDISGFLVGYYLALAAMNALAAWFVWRRSSATVLCRCGRLCVTTVPLWLLTAGMFGLMSATAVGGDAAAIGRISLPQWSQKFLNVALQPTWYTLGTFAALGLLFLARRFFVRPAVAWAMLNLAFFFLGLSMTDPDFARIVGKPDNVPIVGMLFLLGYDHSDDAGDLMAPVLAAGRSRALSPLNGPSSLEQALDAWFAELAAEEEAEG